MKKKKPSFRWRLVKKTVLKILRKKRMILIVKTSKKIGQFYVTLICSSNLRKNRMILVVKTSKKYVTFTTSRLRAFSCTLFHRYSEQRVRGVVMR